VGSVRNLLRLVSNTVPGLHGLFEPVEPVIGTDGELSAIVDVYSQLRPVDFSGEVLRACPRALSVLPVENTGWTDIGSVDRALGVAAGCAQLPIAV